MLYRIKLKSKRHLAYLLKEARKLKYEIRPLKKKEELPFALLVNRKERFVFYQKNEFVESPGFRFKAYKSAENSDNIDYKLIAKKTRRVKSTRPMFIEIYGKRLNWLKENYHVVLNDCSKSKFCP